MSTHIVKPSLPNRPVKKPIHDQTELNNNELMSTGVVGDELGGSYRRTTGGAGSFLNHGMSQLISMVNQLQDAFAATGDDFALELPMIAVVGSQSAGKSSVLENFVGRDFLPRGAGIVTRRPLYLQLLTSTAEYAEFSHQPGKHYTDFSRVCGEIQAETDRETGSNKGISMKPINLKIYSPNVLTLTLVDLPGLTKVAVGDQPKDIDQQIRAMVVEYISRPNCLILAVSPANSDIANSDALKLAEEVDPDGLRTIGVLTKLDLMDQGTDGRAILENETYPLKRGFVGVVNRSQKDIDGRKTIDTALEAERKFFSEHPAYRHLASRSGTGYLQKTLNSELARHISDYLPRVRFQLEERFEQLKREQKQLGEEDLNDPAVRGKIVNEYLNRCKSYLQQDVEGLSRDLPSDNLSGGARVGLVLNKHFHQELQLKMSTGEELNRKIRNIIYNASGYQTGVFIPDRAFEQASRGEIALLEEPVLKMVSRITFQLQRIIESMVVQTFSDYPKLKEAVRSRAASKLRHLDRQTKDHLQYFLDCQMAYINKSNEEFQEAVRAAMIEAGEHMASEARAPKLPERRFRDGQPTSSWLSASPATTTMAGSDVEIFSTDRTQIVWGKKSIDATLVLKRIASNSDGAILEIFTDSSRSKALCQPVPLSQLMSLPAHPDNTSTLTLVRRGGQSFDDGSMVVQLVLRGHALEWRQAFDSYGVPLFNPLPAVGQNGPSDGRPSAMPSRPAPARPDRSRDASPILRDGRLAVSAGGTSSGAGGDGKPADMSEDDFRKVRCVRRMTEAYLGIVHRVVKDSFPKMIVYSLLTKIVDYFPCEVLADVETELGGHAAEQLLEESAERVARRQQVKRALTTTDNAIKAIRTISISSGVDSVGQSSVKKSSMKLPPDNWH